MRPSRQCHRLADRRRSGPDPGGCVLPAEGAAAQRARAAGEVVLVHGRIRPDRHGARTARLWRRHPVLARRTGAGAARPQSGADRLRSAPRAAHPVRDRRLPEDLFRNRQFRAAVRADRPGFRADLRGTAAAAVLPVRSRATGRPPVRRPCHVQLSYWALGVPVTSRRPGGPRGGSGRGGGTAACDRPPPTRRAGDGDASWLGAVNTLPCRSKLAPWAAPGPANAAIGTLGTRNWRRTPPESSVTLPGSTLTSVEPGATSWPSRTALAGRSPTTNTAAESGPAAKTPASWILPIGPATGST